MSLKSEHKKIKFLEESLRIAEEKEISYAKRFVVTNKQEDRHTAMKYSAEARGLKRALEILSDNG